MRSVSILPLATLLLAGCAGQRTLIEEQATRLDSLRAENVRLEERVGALQDTLQFYDDIDTGRYYRDRRVLTQEIEKLEYGISVCRDGGLTIETLLADELFVPGTADLTPAGTGKLASLAEDLLDRFEGRVIRVEGHTDSVPVGPSLAERYPSNWELSAARATTVVRYLVEEGGLPAGQIEAVGYAATRPTARNDSAEGRRLNRRVRIAAMP